jgi:hypothetical protein
MPPSAESPAAAQAQLTQLLSVATAVLHQGIYLVDNVLTSDDQLTIRSKYVTGSTIGQSYIAPFNTLNEIPFRKTFETRSRSF